MRNIKETTNKYVLFSPFKDFLLYTAGIASTIGIYVHGSPTEYYDQRVIYQQEVKGEKIFSKKENEKQQVKLSGIEIRLKLGQEYQVLYSKEKLSKPKFIKIKEIKTNP